GNAPPGYGRQSAGRPLRKGPKGRRGGKSGLHGRTVPDNVRRGQPQGKCHGEGDRRPSAGKGETVREERTARPATARARQSPPGAQPKRGGAGVPTTAAHTERARASGAR